MALLRTIQIKFCINSKLFCKNGIHIVLTSQTQFNNVITIISATDRKGSNSLILAKAYEHFFKSKTQEKVQLLSLEDLPDDLFTYKMYDKAQISPDFAELEQKYLIPAKKLFFVIPEYNGSFPGVLKYFIDACSIKSKMAIFKEKKAGMAGVATGRAGNLRGMEHFGSILNYMGVTVLPNRLPYSTFNQLLDENKKIKDEATLKVLEAHVDEFLKF
jgi:chromate reductase, NAD(P)H dehydrogenase (quinone)